MSEMSQPLRGFHVLLADPDPASRRRLHRILAGAGAAVTEAATFGASLHLVQAGRFGLVMSALRFTEGRGRSLLRAARLRQPEARRVLVVGDGQFDETVEAINGGRPHAIVRHLHDEDAVVRAAGGAPAPWRARPSAAVAAAG